MAAKRIYQGEDTILEIAIVENSTPVDLTAAIDFRVELSNISNSTETSMQFYSKVQPLVGFGIARQKSGSGFENVIEVIVKREQSSLFLVGIVNAEIVTSFADTNLPDDDVKRKVYQFKNIATVEKSRTKDQNI